MITVGIIANPASGKDIRRLVVHGSVFDNDEKVSIVRRVLLGLDAIGVQRVLIMPDSYGIGLRALHTLKLKLDASIMDMRRTFSQEDSRLAAKFMVQEEAKVLVTLGGDGTNITSDFPLHKEPRPRGDFNRLASINHFGAIEVEA